MDEDLAQKAIAKALKGDWKEAIDLNLKIIRKQPDNVDALNRLARAYAETGNVTRAKQYSKKSLSADPFNKIAQKCLSRWKKLKKNDLRCGLPTSAAIFIEEPGKTKIASLHDLGSEKLLANLDAGDEVTINPQGQSVSILSSDGKYIGRLPDDIGARIRFLIKGGNLYRALIKSVEAGMVKVFLRETKCSLKHHLTPSFPPDKKDFFL